MTKLSEEHKAKISKSMIGNKNRLGYKITDEKVLHRISKASRRWHKLKGHKVGKKNNSKIY